MEMNNNNQNKVIMKTSKILKNGDTVQLNINVKTPYIKTTHKGSASFDLIDYFMTPKQAINVFNNLK